MKKIQTGLFRLFTVTAYFAKLNLLWLFFTLLGLGIFGFGPATAVTIKCLHDFRKTGHDYSAVAFWQAYKQAFRTFSLFGIGLLSTILLLLFNLRITHFFPTEMAWLRLVYLLLTILLLYTAFISFMTYAKAEQHAWKQTLYVSIFLVFRYPLQGLALLFTWYLLFLLLTAKTSLLLVFGLVIFLFFAEFFHGQMIEKTKQLQAKRGSVHEVPEADQSL